MTIKHTQYYFCNLFQVDDCLVTVYEDLCLSDCMLSEFNMIDCGTTDGAERAESDGDTIQRMTDAVFGSDDETLPQLKTELIDFVARG